METPLPLRPLPEHRVVSGPAPSRGPLGRRFSPRRPPTKQRQGPSKGALGRPMPHLITAWRDTTPQSAPLSNQRRMAPQEI